MGALDRGTWVDPLARKTTLAHYAAAWLERMTPTWRAGSAAGARNSLERHVLPVLGHRTVASLRKTDVEALCAPLSLAPSSLRIVHQHLGQVLTSAVEDGIIPRSPASRARLPKAEPSKVQPVALEVVAGI